LARTLEHDWYPAQVPDGVVLGERTYVYSSFAFIHHQSARRPSIRVGDDSGIYHATHFDLGPNGDVRVGKYCSIDGTAISTDGLVTIGDYVFVGHGTVIADRADAVPPASRPRIGFRSQEESAIVVGTNVWIGARATILGGSEIGPDAVIGAGAVIDGMRVPAAAVVAGNPARVVGSVRPR
jgi:acetyltransferase-like isoleucine patch superfamily enzyme